MPLAILLSALSEWFEVGVDTFLSLDLQIEKIPSKLA